MKSTDSTAIVASMDDRAVDELLDIFTGRDVRVVRPPRTGLVMMPLTDSFLTDFNLGEVLVTEAVVSVDGSEGYGMVTGDNPRRALARAAAEAVIGGSDLSLLTRLIDLLQEQELLRQEAYKQERALTASTRVNFDLMAGA